MPKTFPVTAIQSHPNWTRKITKLPQDPSNRLPVEDTYDQTLPPDQVLEVMTAPEANRRNVFIGGNMNEKEGTLTLVRGNREELTIPLALFRKSGKFTPDFGRFELDDYGNTLRFGEYEASSDYVLWEVDPQYRERVKKRERQPSGLGASLRRLRIQRGLSEADFGVSPQTILRIERGEVSRPRRRTLDLIERTLRVPINEIESY